MPALALHNPNEMGSGLYDVRASTPKSLSTTPTKPAKKLSNTPKHNLDKDVVKNNRPVQNLGDMKDNIPEWWKMNKKTRESNPSGTKIKRPKKEIRANLKE